MNIETLLSKKDVCARWQLSPRSVDRLRASGRLPWIDVSGGRGTRPAVRFDLGDIERFEMSMKRGQPEAEQSAEG